jgi:hypothetical protein
MVCCWNVAFLTLSEKIKKEKITITVQEKLTDSLIPLVNDPSGKQLKLESCLV